MRFLFLCLLALAGCAADGLPIESPGAGALSDMSPTKPLDMTGGGLGGACVTACDCQPGLACSQGKCARTFLPIFCCDRADACPARQLCETRIGNFGQCGCSNGGPGCVGVLDMSQRSPDFARPHD